ncbi:NapC/NirT family cytochrome c [bacterium]|nr:NapC/NirT family cytochrome c [bacterium]
MRHAYFAFLKGVSSNLLSRIGVIITTTALFSFFFVEILMLLGILNNAYIGLIVYLAFPTLFVVGLMIIPVGWFQYVKTTGKTSKELLTERFPDDILKTKAYGTRLYRTILLLTLLNVIIIGIASLRALHFMESAEFCGTACHSVMNPEWATYQESPHAHVRCVECHVGEGFEALVDSKLNGAWQMISLAFGLYETPIPTPVHNLRPARETCEKCHWPSKFHGTKLETRVHYAMDESNTPEYTTLAMKIGSGDNRLANGVHWHVADKNEIHYAAADFERSKILWLEVKQDDGSIKRYENQSLDQPDHIEEDEVRLMDCVDCHNRATHIYENPERAIDERMQQGLISENLPYIKRQGLAAIRTTTEDKEQGLKIIRTQIENFYRDNFPKVSTSRSQEIEQAVQTLQAIYNRNIHPGMRIDWGAYPNHIGHQDSDGCFRCHNPYMQDEIGNSVSAECTLCHSILAFDDKEPFEYLSPLPEDTTLHDSKSKMHQYLQTEFLESYTQ